MKTRTHEVAPNHFAIYDTLLLCQISYIKYQIYTLPLISPQVPLISSNKYPPRCLQYCITMTTQIYKYTWGFLKKTWIQFLSKIKYIIWFRIHKFLSRTQFEIDETSKYYISKNISLKVLKVQFQLHIKKS